MASNFTKDMKAEAEVSKFIDEYLYPYLGDFQRSESMELQHQGIDVELEMGEKEKAFIDDKCALYYANKNLQSFAFELSFLNQRGNVREGWLLNPDILTTHYNVMWLRTETKQLRPGEIKKENILDVESMIICKKKLLNYLEECNLSVEKLKIRAENFRKANEVRDELAPDITLIKSKQLAERPINLKIGKKVLAKITDYHLKVSKEGVFDLKRGNHLKKKREKKFVEAPGYRAEKLVYNKVEQYYLGDESLTYMHFPLHNYNFQGRREIDILVVDKFSGVSVIEVKGITIDQIVSIQGGEWHVTDYFGLEKINPYRQAELQLNSLCNHLEKDPSLHRSFTKRVVIALPYITRVEWESRGYHRKINMPPVLLRDDIENPYGVGEMEEYHIYKTNKPLNGEQWNLLKSHFLIHEEKPSNLENVYSLLYIFPDKSKFDSEKGKIYENLSKGIKVTLLCYFNVEQDTWLDKVSKYKSARQLEYFIKVTEAPLESYCIVKDGETELPNSILEDFKQFNYQQYKVVHTPVEENLMVTAGAGTGKTHVMVDRIMFLLAKNVSLKNIVMITFTNESTNEMKKRLQKRLIALATLTGKVKFSEFAEEVKEMQISTIHSYSKMILKTLAHEFGYGINVRLRSFKLEKKEIVSKIVDEYYQEHPKAKELHNLMHYELIKIIIEFWEEMDKKGLSEKEMRSSLDWGEATKKSDELIHNLFKEVFSRCEQELDRVKKKENAVSLNDLIRKIKELSHEEEKIQQLQPNKYLFVDEFQDSDNVQIDLVASLANHLNYKLFVVGDVKQSIYRFRGADYRSFDLIRKKVFADEGQSNFHTIELNQNYRTAPAVLEKLDQIFVAWKEKEWLKYNEKLIGAKQGESGIGAINFLPVKGEENNKEVVIKAINDSRQLISETIENDNGKIGLIVRTNSEARKVTKWCSEANIPTMQNLDGTFYLSHAVRDFKSLLDGLLYPNQSLHVLNALQSPYFCYKVPYKVLLAFDGRNDEILKFIRNKTGNDFFDYVRQLRELPVMAVIQKIISEKGVFSNLRKYYKTDQEENLKQFLLQYKKNLSHLMNIIQQQFDVMNVTLYNIHEWLTIQMSTNRTENEPRVEASESLVEVTTVHRAKGLQYHTVIIPKTDFRFDSKKSTFHIEDIDTSTRKRKVGWCIKNKKQTKNSNYDELNQINSNEVYKEETRLLYVAMTRVIENLFIVLPNKKKDKTWSELICESGIEVSEYDS